jgi:hypothetical protein
MECVPLSIKTPPPLIAGSEFQRFDISTFDVNAFSNSRISPRTPDAIRDLARMTSSA